MLTPEAYSGRLICRHGPPRQLEKRVYNAITLAETGSKNWLFGDCGQGRAHRSEPGIYKQPGTMPMSASALLLLAASYIIGCFSTGYYLVRLRAGRDIRDLGSGATGGSNVGRLLGKPGFAITMAGDTLKGALAVGVAAYGGGEPWLLAAAALAVVIGHIFPIQLGGRGGKGLSTALGALLVMDYRLALLVAALVGLSWLLSRQMTFSLVAGLVLAPLLAMVLGHAPAEVILLALMVGLLLYAHRTNIHFALSRWRERSRSLS